MSHFDRALGETRSSGNNERIQKNIWEHSFLKNFFLCSWSLFPYGEFRKVRLGYKYYKGRFSSTLGLQEKDTCNSWGIHSWRAEWTFGKQDFGRSPAVTTSCVCWGISFIIFFGNIKVINRKVDMTVNSVKARVQHLVKLTEWDSQM